MVIPTFSLQYGPNLTFLKVKLEVGLGITSWNLTSQVYIYDLTSDIQSETTPEFFKFNMKK